MNDFTGVTSSCRAVLTRGVAPALLRGVRVVWLQLAEATEGASRGATGVFAVRAVARVGFSGRAVLLVVRSMGIVCRCVCSIERQGGEIGERAWPYGAAMGGCWAGGGVVDECSPRTWAWT